MAVREAADRDHRARRGNARRLIVRLAAAGLVAGAFGQSVAPGLAQDTTSTSSTASDPAPTTPASTLGTTTPTTTQTTADPGTYTVDPAPTMTVPAPTPPPKRKRKSTNPVKPPARCVTGTTGTARKRVAIRSAQENAVGQPRPRTPAATPRCKTTTHPKHKATPQK